MLEDKQPDELPKAPTTIPYGFVLAEETYEENGYMLQKYTREGFAHIDFCRIPCNYTSYQKYYGSIDENGKIEFVHEIEDAQTVIIGEYQGIIYTAIRSYPYTKIAEIEWSDGTYYYKIRSAIDHYYTVFHCMPNKLDDLVSMARNVQ